MLTEYKTWEFTTDDYHRMIETGILGEDDKVELLEGEIVTMAPIGSLHAACVKRLNRLFSEMLGTDIIVGVQDPVTLGRHSEPEPDIALLKPRLDFYASGHPQPEDVLLVVEVADTSSAFDRKIKLPLYAKAGIRESWLANLDEECVEVFSKPSQEGYGRIEIFRKGEAILSGTFPDKAFNVDDIL